MSSPKKRAFDSCESDIQDKLMVDWAAYQARSRDVSSQRNSNRPPTPPTNPAKRKRLNEEEESRPPPEVRFQAFSEGSTVRKEICDLTPVDNVFRISPPWNGRAYDFWQRVSKSLHDAAVSLKRNELGMETTEAIKLVFQNVHIPEDYSLTEHDIPPPVWLCLLLDYKGGFRIR
ncbi:hypothetical protein DL95DRAFT_458630 [Leptodontidium sp. 2 PMI_412]|nr:hypothetical protein DL95DRAFT_458630 [Leptodontidium sp. 2 PMI_412]